LKIIHILLGKANPERANGVNKVVDAYARHLTQMGYETEVWGITSSPAEPTSQRNYTLRLFQAHSWPKGLDSKFVEAL